MKKRLYILLISTMFTAFSCSSVKQEKYNVVNDALADDEFSKVFINYFPNSVYNDSDIIILRKDIHSVKNINYYTFNWDIKIDTINKIKPMFNIAWVDKTKKIILEQPDIAEIRKQINSESLQLWQQSKIKNKKRVILIDEKTLYNDNYIYKSVNWKKNILVYYLTEPVFNIKKNIAVFGFHCYTNVEKLNSSFLHGMAIMKKENNKWTYVGYMSGWETD